jgi:hypothetical protein
MMPDEEIHLHPSRPPTEAEHRFARAVVGVLQFLLSLLAVAAIFAGVAAFVRGAMVLLSGRVGDATSLDGMCVIWFVVAMILVALSLFVYAIEWVKWASGTKPAGGDHDGDWRNFDP